MSAIVCGKRSFFEDIPSPPATVSKRVRCSSSSPVRFSPPRSAAGSVAQSLSSPASCLSLLDHLIAVFPDMDKQLLEKALEECGDDLDLAIKSMNGLRLVCAQNNLCNGAAHSNIPSQASNHPQVTRDEEAAPTDDASGTRNLPMDGSQWVELFVGEMMSASNLDEARVRAARALEALKKSIFACASAEASKNFQQENMMLKEQVQVLIQENAILKRAVSIQHDRQKEFDDRGQELQQLKQLVSQYQEQLRTLEINNYALAMHLKEAQQSNSIPGRFHPDVF
ncbi:hypothetical protein Nepgr_020805 [Nepenthes gracilis]|uniref:CUE domain-containing protein n=1 Tax=Nepenthes gracilis TaxID=150966 RepID=A0AAD3SYD7_NEPGR|nr:hypothetical protein Nepgr_020805 [Nepenthes gracilis]